MSLGQSHWFWLLTLKKNDPNQIKHSQVSAQCPNHFTLMCFFKTFLFKSRALLCSRFKGADEIYCNRII